VLTIQRKANALGKAHKPGGAGKKGALRNSISMRRGKKISVAGQMVWEALWVPGKREKE